MTNDRPHGLAFWSGAIGGVCLIAFGVGGLITDHQATKPPQLAIWFFGAGIAHDAVVAPIVVALGVLTRQLPRLARTPVRLALAASALLTLLVWPLVQGWGVSASNPSALPLDYGRNLLAVLAALWTLTAAATVTRVVSGRR